MTSDLSAGESVNDRSTRHQCCRVEFSENEAPAKTTKARSKRNQVTTVSNAALPLVPLPVGLQSSGMHSNCYPMICYSDDVYLKRAVYFCDNLELYFYKYCLIGLVP
jgi:hypothetical protein